jgi:hypothetical protein
LSLEGVADASQQVTVVAAAYSNSNPRGKFPGLDRDLVAFGFGPSHFDGHPWASTLPLQPPHSNERLPQKFSFLMDYAVGGFKMLMALI